MSACGTPFKSKGGQNSILSPFILLALLLLVGCASWSPFTDRKKAADQIARDGGFHKSFIQTTSFPLTAYVRFVRPGHPLTIYIEGDGSAWLSRTWRADDPTPKTPLVLTLAGMDPAANVAYLARPGQYAADGTSPCDPACWSDRRFSPEVVAAMNEAVEALRISAKANQIHLIGYSGGAAVAVLVAAQRTDVASLRTIAGNLDPDALNRHHSVNPLQGSLNPMAVAATLRNLPQRHFVGSDDAVVPPFIAQSFVKCLGGADGREITVVPGASHAEGWREHWPDLLAMPLQ